MTLRHETTPKTYLLQADPADWPSLCDAFGCDPQKVLPLSVFTNRRVSLSVCVQGFDVPALAAGYQGSESGQLAKDAVAVAALREEAGAGAVGSDEDEEEDSEDDLEVEVVHPKDQPKLDALAEHARYG